jgi:putative flippase GtrA|tara:strand:- start:6833 stop:8197 length:1365 start_codon:yes stop_codon:yes gene_type:complete
MNSMMNFSIILSCYNVSNIIEDICYDFETFSEKYSFELILVNNGSTDNSNEIIIGLCSKFEFIRFANIDVNKGYGNSIKCGISHSKYNIIAYKSADFPSTVEDIFIGYDKFVGYGNNQNEIILKGEMINKKKINIFKKFINYSIRMMLGFEVHDLNCQPTIIHRTTYNQLLNVPLDNSFEIFVLYSSKILGTRLKRYLVGSRLTQDMMRDFDPSDNEQVLQLQKAMNAARIKVEDGKSLTEDGMLGKNTVRAMRFAQGQSDLAQSPEAMQLKSYGEPLNNDSFISNSNNYFNRPGLGLVNIKELFKISWKNRWREQNLFWQLIRYGITGITTNIINYLSFIILLRIYNVHYIYSSILGYLIPFIFGYILHRNFTFRSSNSNIGGQMLAYFIVIVSSLISFSFTIYIFVEYAHVPPEYGQIFAIIIGAIINFTGSKFWVFPLEKRIRRILRTWRD